MTVLYYSFLMILFYIYNSSLTRDNPADSNDGKSEDYVLKSLHLLQYDFKLAAKLLRYIYITKKKLIFYCKNLHLSYISTHFRIKCAWIIAKN